MIIANKNVIADAMHIVNTDSDSYFDSWYHKEKKYAEDAAFEFKKGDN